MTKLFVFLALTAIALGQSTGGSLQISAGPGQNINKQTSAYTAAATDCGNIVQMNGSSLTLTLPSPPPSQTCPIKIQNENSTLLTISRNGLNYNGAAANPPSLSQYQEITITTDGTNYFGPAPAMSGIPPFTSNGSSISRSVLITSVGGAAELSWEGSGNISVNGTRTQISPSSTTPAANGYTTAAAAQSGIDEGGNNNWAVATSIQYYTHTKLAGTGTGDWTDVWLGMTSQTGGTQTTSCTPTANYAAFLYCPGGTENGGDTTHWNACVMNGTTQACSSTGVSADTNFHVFVIVENSANTSWLFYIDGTLDATMSSDLPTGNLQWITEGKTSAAVTSALQTAQTFVTATE